MNKIADVQDLIVTLELPLTFAEMLNDSVREKFRELWQSARTSSQEQEV